MWIWTTSTVNEEKNNFLYNYFVDSYVLIRNEAHQWCNG
jgi:hypothetical protein